VVASPFLDLNAFNQLDVPSQRANVISEAGLLLANPSITTDDRTVVNQLQNNVPRDRRFILGQTKRRFLDLAAKYKMLQTRPVVPVPTVLPPPLQPTIAPPVQQMVASPFLGINAFRRLDVPSQRANINSEANLLINHPGITTDDRNNVILSRIRTTNDNQAALGRTKRHFLDLAMKYGMR
jgi:hypothetical protein